MPKKNSPQRDRRDALEAQWRAIKWIVFVRDSGRCIIHDTEASTVNHILGRGAHPNLFCDIRNLACLCPICDTPDANTDSFIRVQIQTLKKLFSYDYPAGLFEDYAEMTETAWAKEAKTKGTPMESRSHPERICREWRGVIYLWKPDGEFVGFVTRRLAGSDYHEVQNG
jgi:hypothetical protein